MTKFREQRSGFKESMSTVRPCRNMAELKQLCVKLAAPAALENLRLRFYKYDARNNWNTYIVTIKNFGVLGFTDGAPEEEEKKP